MVLSSTPSIFIYTTTAGLGDYLIMGDLMRKVENLLPQSKCLLVHRSNPHIHLWPYDAPQERFFNVYSFVDMTRLYFKLRNAKRNKLTVFGLQMAPGSMQGFYLYFLLKKLELVDYIVDFNLINADIITPPKGHYLLDLHLNQLQELTNISIPPDYYNLELPLTGTARNDRTGDVLDNSIVIGLHPWTRRSHFLDLAWPFEKWVRLTESLLKTNRVKIVIFGKDKQFEVLKKQLVEKITTDRLPRVEFHSCTSVAELAKIVANLDLLISVNTSVVHIGHAFMKRMIVLCGPSLDFWTPKGKGICIIADKGAVFKYSDKHCQDHSFPSISRIKVEDVLDIATKMIADREDATN